MGFAPADALLSGVTRDDKGLPNNYLEGGGGWKIRGGGIGENDNKRGGVRCKI